MLRRALIIAVCAALVGCAHHRVRRLLRSERFEEGVAAAAAARRPVRGATARALAEAKVALSRLGEARDLLQADFRRGGEVKSLFALAALESSMGLDGIAAARWGMLARLAPELVHSDPSACRLLLSRGASRQSWGEFAAADADLELVEALCSGGELRVLGEEATARRNRGYGQAVQDVVARNAPVRCDPGPCQRWGGDVHEPGDAEGTAAGSEVSTYVAQATREFAGRGGVVPITDQEVQAQLGHASRADLDAALRDVPEDVAAYVRLRVSGVWTDAALSPVEAKKLRLRVEESSSA